jgi:hypothetical protein
MPTYSLGGRTMAVHPLKLFFWPSFEHCFRGVFCTIFLCVSLALWSFMGYIIPMRDTNDIIDLTFIVAISAALIIRLIAL